MLVLPFAARALEAFQITEIPGTGRTVAAEIADLDGDGRSDLLEVRFEGIPPGERRSLRVHFQGEDGRIPAAPQLELPLPRGAAAYDLADVLAEPGSELLLLQRDGVRIVSLAGRKARARDARIPDGVTAGPAPDERGLSRLALTSRALGSEPVLVVPGLGEAFLLAPDGSLRARLDTGERTNYFVQKAGPIYAESDIQFFFDVPRLALGDIDGDGRADVLSAARHELRVFLQRPDGTFPTGPSRRIALERVPVEDHMRGSGSVRADARDIDGDGRLDLLISQTSGGITDARSATSIHFNRIQDSGGARAGRWNLAEPDILVERDKAMVADELLDVDGDGRLELLQGRIPVTALELVEVVLTRSLDVHMALFRLDPGSKREPAFEQKHSLPFSFETGRLRGFVPSLDHDLNGDGHRDFVHSTDGSALEIYLGGPGSRYRDRSARQELDTEGVLNPGDLDGDGLLDFVLSNPRRLDAPIRLLTNRGALPGTRPRIRSAASDRGSARPK